VLSHVLLILITEHYIQQLQLFKSIRISYQSLEHFREAHDILRCNANFHSLARFDTVILNTTGIPFGRIEGLFRCQIAGSSTIYELMLVTALRDCKWRPPTSWDNSRVVEPAGPRIIGAKYAIRGALLTDVDLEKRTGRQYIVEDCVDGDMFLRMGN
jgi:hypothetical protein